MDTRRFPSAWKDDSELALVRDQLYPQHAAQDPFAVPPADERQFAVDMINIYLLRNPTTPHAMVATANLTEALLHDEKFGIDGGISPNAMRSIFAMALVKFVNAFVDRDIAKASITSTSEPRNANRARSVQAAVDTLDSEGEGTEETRSKVKGGGESSMYAFAAKIDMPQDFIDLRHKVVHGDIPALGILKRYTSRALDWLWDKWWSKAVHGNAERARALQQDSLRIGQAMQVANS
jgi:ribosomal biogenesis protein LAS1